jgi:mycothiol synthase
MGTPDVRTDSVMRAPATTARPYRDERDWGRVRSLLVEVHALVPPGRAWDVRRWDGWRFHREESWTEAQLANQVGLWETADDRLVGAVHPEGPGEAWIELHPAFGHLAPEMLGWAEEHLALGAPDGTRSLACVAADDDEARRRLLAELGYGMADSAGWQRRLQFEQAPLALRALPEPFRLRTTQATAEDCARMATLLNAGFGRAVHTACEYRTFIDHSPSFEHELNLVAEGPDGSFAAHVGLSYDPVNRHGLIEPVCTHPEYRRRGLAISLLLEGLQRLAARGCRTASLDTGDGEAANALYAECGFTQAVHGHYWRRAWPGKAGR